MRHFMERRSPLAKERSNAFATATASPGWMASSMNVSSLLLSDLSTPVTSKPKKSTSLLLKKTGTPSGVIRQRRSEEHTSEIQSLMRNSYAVLCLNKKKEQK